jgi:uncharacterized protein GlcG (DUF336 family)
MKTRQFRWSGFRMMKRPFRTSRLHAVEPLEARQVLAGDSTDLGWQNLREPADVNGDSWVQPLDALLVINQLSNPAYAGGRLAAPASGHDYFLDVDGNGYLTPLDVLRVVHELETRKSAASISANLGGPFLSTLNLAEQLGSQNLLTTGDVEKLLQRASLASPSQDAIIAVVDRTGRILGVRVEAGVDAGLQRDPDKLAFAIDGAVAKARTAAFFSNNDAPLTSRTIRFISQSTMTQREVESSPLNSDATRRGPGFVAPIGVGGHFPPEVRFTPQVDLFAIEHQSRDGQLHAGADGRKGTADDFTLNTRFNVDPDEIAAGAEDFFATWPESYGYQSGTSPHAQSRGIATLPGGVPLYKIVTDRAGNIQQRPGKQLLLPDINLVGGIGVFFPGTDGFATHEQGFVHASMRGGISQSEFERTNAAKVLESEFIAILAAAGGGIVGPSAFTRDVTSFNVALPPSPLFVLPAGRIDLVGITLEIFGPTPDRNFRYPGIDRLLEVGRNLSGVRTNSGIDVRVTPTETYLAGQAVPEEWLVAPHASADGSLSAEQVEQIITQGIAEADQVRAAIRLDVDNNFRPGRRTKMVLAVTDTSGEVLGLYRMPDATIFSIDVAIAKARNTAYYADAADLQTQDRIDFNGDGISGTISTSLRDITGDTVPRGTVLTNRTFRFLAEPRYPTGIELDRSDDDGLVNSPALNLCDQRPASCQKVGPFSSLRMPGINPLTGENLIAASPLSDAVYSDPANATVLSFMAFRPSRNFRDVGDTDVLVAGTAQRQPLANQNGVVFFPGSTSVHVGARLAGGFGVSGDGVDQDDVVTVAGQRGFAPADGLRVDQFVVGGVRLPFQKFNRNPRGR